MADGLLLHLALRAAIAQAGGGNGSTISVTSPARGDGFYAPNNEIVFEYTTDKIPSQHKAKYKIRIKKKSKDVHDSYSEVGRFNVPASGRGQWRWQGCQFQRFRAQFYNFKFELFDEDGDKVAHDTAQFMVAIPQGSQEDSLKAVCSGARQMYRVWTPPQFNGAMKMLQSGQRHFGAKGRLLYGMANCQSKAGNTDEALKYLQQAVGQPDFTKWHKLEHGPMLENLRNSKPAEFAAIMRGKPANVQSRTQSNGLDAIMRLLGAGTTTGSPTATSGQGNSLMPDSNNFETVCTQALRMAGMVQQARQDADLQWLHITCNGCMRSPQGVRWKCSRCPDFDFCQSCYGNANAQNHDPSHTFDKHGLDHCVQQLSIHMEEVKRARDRHPQPHTIAQRASDVIGQLENVWQGYLARQRTHTIVQPGHMPYGGAQAPNYTTPTPVPTVTEQQAAVAPFDLAHMYRQVPNQLMFGKHCRAIEVAPEHPALQNLFHPKEIPVMYNLQIARVLLVWNDNLSQGFGAHILKCEARAQSPDFRPAANLLQGHKGQTLHALGQRALPPHLHRRQVMVVKAWHGTDFDSAVSICSNGAGAVEKIDGGWFGKGIYSTTYPDYALMYASARQRPALVLHYAIMANPYPVTFEEARSDSAADLHFMNKGAKGSHDSHYVRVAKRNNGDFTYLPPQYPDHATHDEIVLFQEAAFLPRVIIELQRVAPAPHPVPVGGHAGGTPFHPPNHQLPQPPPTNWSHQVPRGPPPPVFPPHHGYVPNVPPNNVPPPPPPPPPPAPPAPPFINPHVTSPHPHFPPNAPPPSVPYPPNNPPNFPPHSPPHTVPYSHTPNFPPTPMNFMNPMNPPNHAPPFPHPPVHPVNPPPPAAATAPNHPRTWYVEPVAQWNVDQVVQWCNNTLQMPDVATKFRRLGMGGDVLLSFTELGLRGDPLYLSPAQAQAIRDALRQCGASLKQ